MRPDTPRSFHILDGLCVTVLVGIFLIWLFPPKFLLPSKAYYFMPATTQQDQEIFLHLLQAFQKVVEPSNITYMIVGGTLIGALRHHGMVPWDDDVDIFVDGRQRDQLEKVLSNLSPKFELHKNTFPAFYWNQQVWKLCLAGHGVVVDRNTFRWPYLDIALYEENETHIHFGKWSESYYKKHVFPLRRLPFGLTVWDVPPQSDKLASQLLWLPAPCRSPPGNYLNICTNNVYSHKSEFPLFLGFQHAVQCRQLRFQHPFVNHVNSTTVGFQNVSKLRTQSFEELQLNGERLYRISIEKPVCNGERERPK